MLDWHSCQICYPLEIKLLLLLLLLKHTQKWSVTLNETYRDNCKKTIARYKKRSRYLRPKDVIKAIVY